MKKPKQNTGAAPVSRQMTVAEALEHAIAHHRAGRLTAAEPLYRAILHAQPEHPAANRNLRVLALGALLARAASAFQSGDLATAEAACRQALAQQPNHAESLHQLGLVMFRRGDLTQAERLIGQAIAQQPDVARYLVNHGAVLRALGHTEQALAAYERALHLQPELPEAHNNRANALNRLGRAEEALLACDQALRLKPDYAQAHNNRGDALNRLGRSEEALAACKQALDLQPELADAHNNCGIALHALGCLEQALGAYEQALRLKPDDAEAHNNRGTVLNDLKRSEEALSAFEQALHLKPAMAEAHFNYLESLERLNRVEAIPSALADARAQAGEDERFAMIEALLCKRVGDFAGARRLLGTVPATLDLTRRSRMLGVLGEVCDRLGETAAAMAAFREANALGAQAPQWRRVDAQRFRKHAEDTIALVRQWRQHPPSGSGVADDADHQRPALVFLVGFPRSGTTLLDTVLRSHSLIDVVEESPALGLAEAVFRANTSGLAQALERADPQIWQLARHRYFEELAAHGNRSAGAARIIIDKLPLHAVKVPVIRALFPSARFILALRHPCDAVLSCFMNKFAPNDAMANFFTLEDSARLYDLVMRAWQASHDLWDLPVQRVRYEDLIADLEGTLAPVLAFLGLAWEPALTDYAATARARGRINTPSYHQVVQPLYSHAKGRWERYRQHLEPVLPVLAPWVERWGYAPIGEDGAIRVSEGRR